VAARGRALVSAAYYHIIALFHPSKIVFTDGGPLPGLRAGMEGAGMTNSTRWFSILIVIVPHPTRSIISAYSVIWLMISGVISAGLGVAAVTLVYTNALIIKLLRGQCA